MKRKLILAAGALVILAAGFACAGGGSDGSGNSADPTTVVETETVTETVTRDVTPEACIQALDVADVEFTLAAQGIDYFSQSFQAVRNRDVAEMERLDLKVNQNQERIRALAPRYRAAKEECRAAAG